MRITAIAVAGLVASTLVTASAAQAEVTAQPAQSHFYPLQPPPGPSPDPAAEAQELRQQISELHDNWDSLTPAQRNQQIAQLQQQVTAVDRDTRNLPPDQKAAVEATLLPSAVELADLLGKAQASNPQQPCVLFVGPPPCGL
jgi:TolA-binding protein